MDAVWKIGLGFILGTVLACFSVRVPYWPAHISNMDSMCYAGDQITLAALTFERLGLLSR